MSQHSTIRSYLEAMKANIETPMDRLIRDLRIFEENSDTDNGWKIYGRMKGMEMLLAQSRLDIQDMMREMDNQVAHSIAPLATKTVRSSLETEMENPKVEERADDDLGAGGHGRGKIEDCPHPVCIKHVEENRERHRDRNLYESD